MLLPEGVPHAGCRLPCERRSLDNSGACKKLMPSSHRPAHGQALSSWFTNKDGSHRFCVDYQQLNAVTKANTLPLPTIDDLLDQLGQCKYFSTLDLASGYWQIRVAPTSREKTAFITPQGLFEFLVMPFGLTNAPQSFSD